jgi:hypothetical protein
MCIKVLDVARCEPALPERRRHRACRTFVIFRPRSHVARIRRGPVTDQFGHGLRAPRPRMFQSFDDEDARIMSKRRTLVEFSVLAWNDRRGPLRQR